MAMSPTPDFELLRARPADWARVRTIRLRALRDAPDAFASSWQREQAWAPGIWQDRLAATDAATFIVARTGRSLRFDPSSEQIVDDPEANALIHRKYRENHWARPSNA